MTLGLGSGSTAAELVRLLGARVRGGLRVRGVPTSPATAALARAEGIALTNFDEVDRLDLALDGADEIDAQLRLIKGGGGALLHEKIVLAAAARKIIFADDSKEVAALGARPLPVEVIGFGWPTVARAIVELGGVPERRAAGGEPFVTEEGNYILDCRFAAIPDELGAALAQIPGVVAHGLFIGLCDIAVIARANEVVIRAR